jgi:16S rRNA C967 or C1407 C5-methylase (RsmB/RsmF family)
MEVDGSRWKALLQSLQMATDRSTSIEAALQQPPPRSIRLRPDQPEESLPFEVDQVPWHPLGRWLVDSQLRPSQSLYYAAGRYYIQDAGSLLAVRLLDVQPSQTVCDLCAAPGGKASAILEQLGPEGFLVANEPIAGRTELLRWVLHQTGNPSFATCRSDPEWLVERFSERFDAVLVDAPCSGQAMVAAGKRSSNAFSPPQILHAAARQKRILDAASRLVAPGGRLVYSTCTFATEENEEVVQWLEASQPGCWESRPVQELVAWQSRLHPSSYRVWPDHDRCEGAFAAVLHRTSQAIPPYASGVGSKGASKNQSSRLRKTKLPTGPSGKSGGSEAPLAALNSFGSSRGLALQCSGGYVLGTPLASQSWLAEPFLEGCQLLQSAGPTWQPCHALAKLDRRYFTPYRSVELGMEQAERWARGESGRERLSEVDGWCVANWNGLPLGWIKQQKDRWSNPLPAIGRIQIKVSLERSQSSAEGDPPKESS